MKFSKVSIFIACSLVFNTAEAFNVYRYGFYAPETGEYFSPNTTLFKNQLDNDISHSANLTTKTIIIKDWQETLGDKWEFFGGKYLGENSDVAGYTLNLDNINGSSILGYGGQSFSGNVSQNKIFINSSNIKSVYGGDATNKGSATENEVKITNSTVTGYIYGGNSSHNIASSNKVIVENSIVNKVYGGYGNTAVGNSVFFNKATIKDSIYGANKLDNNHYDNNLILIGYDNNAKSISNFNTIKFGSDEEKLTWKKNATVLTAGAFTKANNLDVSNIVFPKNFSEEFLGKMTLIKMSENKNLPEFSLKNGEDTFNTIPDEGITIPSALPSVLSENFKGFDISLNYSPIYNIVKEGNALISEIKGKVNEVVFGEIPWKEENEPLITADETLDFNGAKVDTGEVVFMPTTITELLENDKMILIKDFGNSVGDIKGTKYKIGTTLEGEGSAKLENTDLIFLVQSNSAEIPKEEPTPTPTPTPTPPPTPTPTPPPKPNPTPTPEPKKDGPQNDNSDDSDDTDYVEPTEPIKPTTPPKEEPKPEETKPTESDKDKDKDSQVNTENTDNQDQGVKGSEENNENQDDKNDQTENGDNNDNNNSQDDTENADNNDNKEDSDNQDSKEQESSKNSTDNAPPSSQSSIATQEQTHNTVMSMEAGMAALAAANDYISAAMDGISIDSRTSSEGVATYAGMGGATSKTKTGSSVSAHLWNAILALGQERKLKSGIFSYGVFFEYGKASYTLEPDNGMKGNSNYRGGGIFLKHKNNRGVYVEGSFRGGKMTDSADRILQDGLGNGYGYNVSTSYFGLHLGVGKVYELKNNYELDAYCKFFYTRRGGVSYDAGGHYDLKPVSSKVLRIGARYGKMNVGWNSYVGLSYAYEFDSVARGTADGFAIRPASAKGGTIYGEIGLRLNPSATSRWKSDISLKMSAGKTRGFGGNISLMYLF